MVAQVARVIRGNAISLGASAFGRLASPHGRIRIAASLYHVSLPLYDQPQLEQEVIKFSNMSAKWWDPHKNPLIAMNIVRVQYIQSILNNQRQILAARAIDHLKSSSSSSSSSTAANDIMERSRREVTELSQCKILDIGCGGGLLSESLVRLGAAHVTGIDPSEPLIEVARSHASRTLSPNILSRLDYRVGEVSMIRNEIYASHPTKVSSSSSSSSQNHSDLKDAKVTTRNGEHFDHDEKSPLFDIICLMEVIEHVSDIPALLENIAPLVHPDGGLIILSTLNRTVSSYFTSILGAEYLMRYLPIGTHDWNKYCSPNEIQMMMESVGMNVLDVSGMVIDMDSTNSPWWLLPHTMSSPAAWNWRLDPFNMSVNWIGTYRSSKRGKTF